MYKALWFGFAELLCGLCENLIKVTTDDDHQLKVFADEMVTQIKSAAPKATDSLFGLNLKFKIPENDKRHQTMLIALRQHMQRSTNLFQEPGFY